MCLFSCCIIFIDEAPKLTMAFLIVFTIENVIAATSITLMIDWL